MISRVDDIPFIKNDLLGDDIDQIIDDYNLMGSNNDVLNPDLYMGGWLKRLVRRIRDRVRKRRAERANRGIVNPPNYSLTTPGGTVSAGASGFSFLPSQTGQTNIPGLTFQQQQVKKSSIMDSLKDNPMLIAIPAIAALLLLSKK